MKFRSGFVSNSSSSSYLIYGFFKNSLPVEIQKKLSIKETDWANPSRKFFHGEDLNIIGISLAEWSDTDIIDQSVDLSQENREKMNKEVKDMVREQTGFEVSDKAFNLIGTTYYN